MSARTAAETRMVALCMILGELIQEVGHVPSGELYARVMSHMNLETYNAVISALKHGKLVTESAHVLTWIGPVKETK